MTSSSEARRPSVRLALAEVISMRLAEQPISPYSVVKREASMPARAAKQEEAMTPAANAGGNGFFVAPVAVAIDRTGGHAAMREDILLPLDVSDDAASRLALKLCQETGMAPASAEAIKEQVLEYLAPFREVHGGEVEMEEKKGEVGGGGGGGAAPSTSGRAAVSLPRPRAPSPPSSPRVVELELDTHCDGVRVRDRLLWDLGDPAPLPAAWAAETAKDLGLSADGCRALRLELEAAVAAARRSEGRGVAGATAERDPDASSWLPRVAEDRGGWGDA